MNSVEFMSENQIPEPAITKAQYSPREKIKRAGRGLKHAFFTYDGLIGDVDYAYLFTPSIPFISKKSNPPLFFGLQSKMPILLACLLGLQHAMSMMGGLVSANLIFANVANMSDLDSAYLVSASLIASGILSFMQMMRVRIPFTKKYLGTGMVSVLGVSFATIPVFQSAVAVMYESGFCPTDADGTKLACPDAYGAFLGTSALCALFQILLAFTPQKVLLKVFPPIVNGPVVLMIGATLVQSAVEDWAGGSGCMSSSYCPSEGAPNAHPWGSGQFIGLGFSVFVTIVICDKFGAPFMKSCSIICGLLVGCIIAAATGYFSHESIDAAPAGEFLWVRTFKLSLYGPIVLPLFAVYIVTTMETIGDITATADVSRLEVEGEEFESRVQGGVLGAGFGSVLGGLMTVCPMAAFAQNNGVIAMTQCASRYSGFFAAFWLLLMGVIGKFSAAIVAIPKAVIGGMTAFLFTSVAVSGLSIISRLSFTRRDRVVLTVGFMWGFAALLVPDYFSKVFTYDGDNSAKQGFIDAIVIVVETPPAIAGIAAVICNLIMPPVSDGEDPEKVDIHQNQESFEGLEVVRDDASIAEKK